VRRRLRSTQIATCCNPLQLPTTTQLLPQLLVPPTWIRVSSPNGMYLNWLLYTSLHRTSPRRSCGATLLLSNSRTMWTTRAGSSACCPRCVPKVDVPNYIRTAQQGGRTITTTHPTAALAAVPSTARNADTEDEDDESLVDRGAAKIRHKSRLKFLDTKQVFYA
jgi:hypothetical protein